MSDREAATRAAAAGALWSYLKLCQSGLVVHGSKGSPGHKSGWESQRTFDLFERSENVGAPCSPI